MAKGADLFGCLFHWTISFFEHESDVERNSFRFFIDHVPTGGTLLLV